MNREEKFKVKAAERREGMSKIKAIDDKTFEGFSTDVETLSPEQGAIIEKEALNKYKSNKPRTHYIRNFFILSFLIAAILEFI